MMWPWKKRKDSLEVSKEALIDWRERLLKTAYALRINDRIASRYMFNTSDEPEVKSRLNEAWVDESGNMSEIWGVIGSIENILLMKHNVFTLNALDLHQLKLNALDRDIMRLEQEKVERDE